MRWRRAETALLAWAACAGAQAAPVEYSLRIDPGTAIADARVCVATPARWRRFEADHERATDVLLEARRSGGGELTRRDGALVAPDWQAGECLEYRADVGRVADARREGLGWRASQLLLLSPHAWLWRPRDLARDPRATVQFELPEGWSLSVPWAPLDAAPPRRRFRVGDTWPYWPALVAIGRFAESDVDAPGGAIRLALPGVDAAPARTTLTRFIDEAAADVGATFPRLFAQRPQVVAIPAARGGRDAIPFGQTHRGGGTAVLLYVDPARPLADFHASWTLTHELVHLVHPYLGDGGRWIAEGVATYYQNVVRARRGRYTPRRAWEELVAGFERGRRQASDLTLTETSERLDRTRPYMRAYWAGTALMLRGDVALRTRAGDPASLDAALNRFVDCCRDQRFRRSAAEFLALLDREVGGDTFTTLHARHANAAAFPDVDAALAALGIEWRDGTITRMSGDPRAVALRTAIMGSD